MAISENTLRYIKSMPMSEQTKIGREIVQMKQNGTPEELIDDVMVKRLGIVEEKVNGLSNNKEIKDTLGEILTSVKEVKQFKEEFKQVKDAISGIQVWQTDLPPLTAKELGINVNAPVDIGKTDGMTSRITVKEEMKKDDTSDIVGLLKQMKNETK